jgi:signal transduction histidine kinase/ActR/RegA family two-component response regulator
MQNSFKKRLWNVISSGMSAESDLETIRKVVLLNLIILVGSFFLALLAAIAFVENDYVLAGADSAALAFIVALFCYMRSTRNHHAVGTAGTATLGVFYTFLIAYGGINNTAYVWAFTYPLIALFLLGLKRGSLMALLLLAAATIVFTLGPKVAFLTTYGTDLIIRFIPAYAVVFMFAFVMEKVRETVQVRLEKANQDLGEALGDVREHTSALTQSNQVLQAEILERERVEKALRDSEGFLEDVIESIQDGISVLNPDLTIRHTNSIMRKWYAANLPLVGKKCHECYHSRRQPCDPCPSLRSLRSGRTEWETVRGLPGSPAEWLEVSSFPIKDEESGRITGIVEFVRDITEQRRLENQLAQAERMDSIGRLAGGIAHDFNNLLMGIQGNASLMRSQLEPRHPCVDYLQKIDTYVKNASELTGRLLGFARGGKYQVQATNLNPVVKENLDMFERTKKELRIRSTFDADLWSTEVDKGQINQVFLNLFVNAWEAMPSGGELRVKTENVFLDENFAMTHEVPAGKYVKVAVSDTGFGMDEMTKARIFDPFFTTKEKGRGTGLGLASAYGIVRNHHGILAVDSQPQQGATFSVFLPATDKAVPQVDAAACEVARGSETVLLVDDEDMIIDVGRRLLERLGYRVRVARDGLEAVDTYRADRDGIDCVILDVIMPEVNGAKAYDLLKQIDPDVKVLLASGYSLDGKAAEILKRGCNGFIQKPFNIGELSQKIRQVLDGGQVAA